MTKYLIVLVFLATSLQANAIVPADDPYSGFAPKIGISIDYIPAANNMYGITLSPYHYDRDYAQWGYYIGYAKSSKEDMVFEGPSEGYTQDILWRFGLSYSLTSNVSIYGGATTYNHETHYTNNIMPLIVGGEPVWEEEKESTWGAEVGLRYMMDFGLLLSTGYNTATETAVISIGWVM